MDAQRRGNPRGWKKIDSLLKTIYSNGEPGVSIAILQKGSPVFKYNYGLVNIDSKKKISSKTNFNIASLTKQFTAAAILQLAQKNKLSLSDKISKFFPDLNKKVAESVTIRQLLTHSSGIIDHYDYANKDLRHAHNADVFSAIKNIDSTYFSPGSSYRYSNTAYCLLALIVEKLSGMRYDAYMKRNIFQPLKMLQTTIWNEKEEIVEKATGYEYDKTTNSFKSSGPAENVFFSTEGDGGVYTCIDDYLKWFEALQSGKIISKTMVQIARSPQVVVNKEKRLNYGYGWFIDESSSPLKVYHSGSNGGFRSFSFSIPDENFLIVIFSNRTGVDLEKLVMEIYKILNPESEPFTRIETFISFQDCYSIFAPCKKTNRFSILFTKS
jgi:CubicO group peptidase (beta-lactamase class C family)